MRPSHTSLSMKTSGGIGPESQVLLSAAGILCLSRTLRSHSTMRSYSQQMHIARVHFNRQNNTVSFRTYIVEEAIKAPEKKVRKQYSNPNKTAKPGFGCTCSMASRRVSRLPPSQYKACRLLSIVFFSDFLQFPSVLLDTYAIFEFF